jgi:hypothetical protein
MRHLKVHLLQQEATRDSNITLRTLRADIPGNKHTLLLGTQVSKDLKADTQHQAQIHITLMVLLPVLLLLFRIMALISAERIIETRNRSSNTHNVLERRKLYALASITSDRRASYAGALTMSRTFKTS